MNYSHPLLWARASEGGAFCVPQLHRVFVDAGIPSQRNGKWLMDAVVVHADALETFLATHVPPTEIPIEIPIDPPIDPLAALMGLYGDIDVSDIETTPASILPTPLIDQCHNDVHTEALEWLMSIVSVCYNTDTGIILLENDLALFVGDRPDASEWLTTMRKEWESRIHSGWLDQFMSALELWVASKLTHDIG